MSNDPGAHTKGDISNLAIATVIDSRDTLELQGRVVAEQNLGRILNSPLPGVDELLDEDLAKYSVRLLPKDGAEYDGHAVETGLDVDSLLLAIVDSHDLASLTHTLRGLL